MMILRTAFVLLAINSFGASAALAKAPAASPRVYVRPTPSRKTNAVAMAGPTLGNRELRTNKCVSGQNFLFRGADIFDETTKGVLVLRLVLDPIEGPVAKIYMGSEFGKSIVLRREDCKMFKYELENTGNSYNFVSEVSVAVRLDCRSKAGDFVVGRVKLPACP